MSDISENSITYPVYQELEPHTLRTINALTSLEQDFMQSFQYSTQGNYSSRNRTHPLPSYQRAPLSVSHGCTQTHSTEEDSASINQRASPEVNTSSWADYCYGNQMPANAAFVEPTFGVPVPLKYKLYYFHSRGLAEPLRYLMAYGGIVYEDIRFTTEEWLHVRDSMPMHQLPVLEVNGSRIYQSISIARYLGKLVGLSGHSAWEDLQIDSIVDTINDLRLKISDVGFNTWNHENLLAVANLNDHIIPTYLQELEHTVTANSGFFALSRLTWADIYFAGIINFIKYISHRDLLAPYPMLRGNLNIILNCPPISDFIAMNRPAVF